MAKASESESAQSKKNSPEIPLAKQPSTAREPVKISLSIPPVKSKIVEEKCISKEKADKAKD